MRILIVEDEERISKNLKKFLESSNFTADISPNGEDGLIRAETEDYDLVILDWMLPNMDGTAVCEKLKKSKPQTPILMLTAKSQLDDKIEGFKKGADDYLTKPFAMEEILMRVKALLRRKQGTIISPVITLGKLSVNINICQVTKAGKVISLSPKEYALLEYLAMNKCKAIDRLTILEHVWGETANEFSNTVDVHIRYLRRKIDLQTGRKLIRTIPGRGYMICDK
jgi:two-component system copper resistance phosphate regulon response regulator CusR